jgi:5-methylcytosine-specific restriction endonuclease McrA
MQMLITCQECGQTAEMKRSTAKWCSVNCRVRNSERRRYNANIEAARERNNAKYPRRAEVDAERAWKQANPGIVAEEKEKKAKATQQAHYEANRERLIARSIAWQKANPDKVRGYVRNQKRRRRNTSPKYGYPQAYSDALIYKRDGGVCQLCMLPIPQQAVWPEPLSFVVDHIRPLSKGGADNPRNVRAAHNVCNTRRNNNRAWRPTELARKEIKESLAF